MKNIHSVTIQEDGSLYFVAEIPLNAPASRHRFMECVVEYDEEDDKFRLMANDSVLAEF